MPLCSCANNYTGAAAPRDSAHVLRSRSIIITMVSVYEMANIGSQPGNFPPFAL